MNIFNQTYELSNGIKIPKLGLGTWLIPNDKVSECIKHATEIGYRHIDTAQAYENEEGIGIGLRNINIPRKELFITTKVRAEYKTYEEAKKSIDESLNRLGLEYIDLIIIHSPQPWMEFRDDKRYFEENINVWKALEDAYKEGKVKAIGVSNFLIDDLDNLINNCEIKPMVNQILTHISNTPLELIDYCKKNNILVEAYSPIAHGAANKSSKIAYIANKYGVTVAQLCIKYTLQLELVTLPKTSNTEHMKTNSELDFIISDEDMELLKSLKGAIDYGSDKVFPVFSGK